MKILVLSFSLLIISGCSVFGKSEIETAPYKLIKSDISQSIEVRQYNNLILVSTEMEEGRNGSFRRLFGYITGDNVKSTKIEMTTPVFMGDEKNDTASEKIEMTAPVFMVGEGSSQKMSFVLPGRFTMDNTPQPTNSDVKIEELNNYNVASIRFNGRLQKKNIEKHKAILEAWIKDQDYLVSGLYSTAAYDAPFTLPVFRRNEVLIPVKLP